MNAQTNLENINRSLHSDVKHTERGVLPEVLAPPANDNYANAQFLVLGAGVVGGTTRQATIEAGEVLACQDASQYAPDDESVWYYFTATANITYVQIQDNGHCLGGSAIWPSGGLPTSNCNVINCQDGANSPVGAFTTVYQLNTTIGTSYYIQVTGSQSGCGDYWKFKIAASNVNPGGTLTNPPYPDNCVTANVGCYFTIPPTVPTVTSTCSSYPLATTNNLVFSGLYSFTTAPTNSTAVEFQTVISSTCGVGNIDWFMWKLYDSNCTLVDCGDDINASLSENNTMCNTTYYVQYAAEEVGCTYTSQYPYQDIPLGTIGCGTLPIELLYFYSSHNKSNETILIWATATETNNNFFTIEKSVDGIYFKEIGKIKGAGNSTTKLNYSLRDEEIQNGVAYYKLKQTDYNGVSVTFNEIAVYTNLSDALKIIKTTNLLGQDVSNDYDGVRIIYYSDGSIIKKTGK